MEDTIQKPVLELDAATKFRAERAAEQRPQRKHEFSRIRETMIIGLTVSRLATRTSGSCFFGDKVEFVQLN